MYRLIDFKRDNHGIEGTVKTIEYDPNRTARIALVNYKNGDKRYIVAPVGLKVGQKVLSGTNMPRRSGTPFLEGHSAGYVDPQHQLRPGQGAVMARSAGSFAQLAACDGNYAIIKMPSGETRKVLASCLATIGTVSNPDHNKEN